MKHIRRARSILISLVILLLISRMQGSALDKMRFASLIEKFEDGYLISIVPREPGEGSYMRLEFTGLDAWPGKYLKLFESGRWKNLYIPVEKSDYRHITEQLHYDFGEKLCIYDDQNRHTVVQGEKFYLKICPLGLSPFIEDICVFVKTSVDFDKRRLIWAKNLEAEDEDFERVEERSRTLNDWFRYIGDPATKEAFGKIHIFIRGQLSQTRKARVDGSQLVVDTINISKYEENVFEISLSPERKNYLVAVNGESVLDQIFFRMGLLLDEKADIREPLVAFDIWKQLSLEGFWNVPQFKVEHIYHSTKLRRDVAIFLSCTNSQRDVFLLFERDGKPTIMRMSPRLQSI